MKWTHGHSIGTGTLLGVSFSHYSTMLAFAGFVAGLLIRDTYNGARWLVRRISWRLP